jgi:serine/threonine protein kinase
MAQPDAAPPVGNYRLVEKLGEGGMGMVFRGELRGEAGFRKTVAVKLMHGHLRADPGLLERFAAEARTNARLDHPNIVHVLEFGLEPEPHLVMEFVEGVSLWSLMARLYELQGQMVLNAALFIGAEAALGLDHAHRRTDEKGTPLGIVHRDVSPTNILISNEGAVKLSDFGLVMVADHRLTTQDGMPVGKLVYMAPEQMVGAAIDARADVFSLGVVLWEMLTLKRLLPADDPAMARAQLLTCDFAPPSTTNPLASPALDEIVLRCLRLEPNERWPSAEALSLAMRQQLHLAAPGYDRVHLAQLVRQAFPERGWDPKQPAQPPPQPSPEQRMSMPEPTPAIVSIQRSRESGPPPTGIGWVADKLPVIAPWVLFALTACCLVAAVIALAAMVLWSD